MFSDVRRYSRFAIASLGAARTGLDRRRRTTRVDDKSTTARRLCNRFAPKFEIFASAPSSLRAAQSARSAIATRLGPRASARASSPSNDQTGAPISGASHHQGRESRSIVRRARFRRDLDADAFGGATIKRRSDASPSSASCRRFFDARLTICIVAGHVVRSHLNLELLHNEDKSHYEARAAHLFAARHDGDGREADWSRDDDCRRSQLHRRHV